MPQPDLDALAQQVLWAGFGLSLLFGVLAQRTRFCTMGAVADIVNLGDWTRMRMWVLAMAVAMLGFNGLVALGELSAADTIYAGPRLTWLSALVGGAMFGFGMVLASGCGSRTLVRIGGGSLKSLVVFLVMGLAAYMTLRGLTGVWRVETVDRVSVVLPGGQDLPSLFSDGAGTRGALALALGSSVSMLLIAWVLSRPEGRRAETWLGGAGIGFVVTAVWWVSGRLGYVAEDPNTLEEAFVATQSRRMESLSFVAPAAYALDWLLYYSDAARRLTLGIVSVVGVVLGAALQALFKREFRWEGFRDTEDTAHHLLGATLMGIGGVTALGCTIGQGVSGLSTLALGSFIALAAILAGAVAGLRYLGWRIGHGT